MADEKSRDHGESRHTLTDDQIVTERTLRRRSFLTAAGALVAGGAVAIALGGRTDAIAQSSDPDKVRDPDKARDPHKARDPDKVRDPDKTDPDKARHMRGDPDRKKHMRGDPDRTKLPPPPDPHR